MAHGASAALAIAWHHGADHIPDIDMMMEQLKAWARIWDTRGDIDRNAASSACAKGGEWKLALDILNRMFEACVERDVISYTAATNACGKGGY